MGRNKLEGTPLYNKFLAIGYELIHTMDEKDYMLIPINNPHQMWTRLTEKQLDAWFMNHTQNQIVVVEEEKKTTYYLHNSIARTMAQSADMAFDALGIKGIYAHNAKPGEHTFVLFVDRKINPDIDLNKITLDFGGRNVMNFTNFTPPFGNPEPNKYYIGGWGYF